MKEEVKIPEWNVELDIESSGEKINSLEFIDFLMDKLIKSNLQPSIIHRRKPSSSFRIIVTLKGEDILLVGVSAYTTVRSFMKDFGILDSNLKEVSISESAYHD
jgi:hypothetical protein